MNHPIRFALGPATTARSLTLDVLHACRSHHVYAQDALHAAFAELSLSAADRRLATQLTIGIVRRRGTLDGLLQKLVERPQRQVDPVLWEILQLGAFQLALLTQIPAYAVLNESVELAGRLLHPHLKGFVNGVLRNLARTLTETVLNAPAADALPIEEGRYRQLTRPMLPDPIREPLEYLASGLSLPTWLADRWLRRNGWDEALRLGFWFAGPAPVWLRVNALKTTRAEYLSALAAAGIAAEAGAHPQSVRLHEHESIPNLPGFAEGWFAVQDSSAMAIASALAPTSGSRVLDLCAAPGGKTTHLAELMGNQGTIVACEVDEVRLRTVTELARRLGISIIESVVLDPEKDDTVPPGPFDAILVDAPCSNTGVLGRRPEVRWRLTPKDFRYLVPLQTRLLHQAAVRLQPGGALVYSTCSIEPEENGDVVRAVVRSRPDLIVEDEADAVPGRPADGGYWARLRKRTE